MKATVLSGAFDMLAVRSRPGLYVATSGTPAYAPLRAMAIAGLAKQVGEHMLRDGRRVITISTGNGYRANPPVTDGEHTITVGQEYLTAALREYTSWQSKFYREAIQNSVDAGAKHVDIKSKKNENGTWTITVMDDGKGMSEDVLMNKFLVFGGTTKVGAEGTTGGFGKAKELLILPWISWKVRSRDTEVSGSGLKYRVTKPDPIPGTVLEVVMAADNYAAGYHAISVVQKSYIPHVEFNIDGTKYKAELKAKGDPIDSLPGKVDIYFNEGKVESSYMIVRAHGLYMFDMYLGDRIPGFVIVEITGPSIELLASNRDSFRDWNTRRKVEEFVIKIAKNVSSATRNKKGMIRQKFVGSGKFKPQRAAQALIEVGPVHEPKTKNGVELGDAAIERVAAILEDYRHTDGADDNKIGSVSGELARAFLGQMKVLGTNHVEAATKQLVWQPDFYLINDIEGFKVPKKFFVGTMTPTVLKLAKVWTEMCRFVLIQLGCSFDFGVGFIFSENTLAAQLDEDGGDEHWLLLNPFKKLKARDEMWSPAKTEDLQWLYASAIHECTHLVDSIGDHDEAFSSAMTMNIARCANGFRRIKQIVASIRMKDSPSLEGPATPAKKSASLDAVYKRVTELEESIEEAKKAVHSTGSNLDAKVAARKRQYALEDELQDYRDSKEFQDHMTRENPSDLRSVSLQTGKSTQLDTQKKLLMAIYKRLKQVGDGRIVNGKHVVMHAPSGYKTFVLEDMSYEELDALGRKLAGVRANPRPYNEPQYIRASRDRARTREDDLMLTIYSKIKTRRIIDHKHVVVFADQVFVLEDMDVHKLQALARAIRS